jgi:hypothetical protein
MANGLETIRGSRKFADRGYQYVFDRSSTDGAKLFWRCDQKTNGCSVRIHTEASSDQVVKRMHEHNHGSNAAAIEVNRTRTAMKRRAETSVETPAQIITHETQNLTQSVQGQMPRLGTLRKAIQRKRKRYNAAPAAPLDLTSMVIPDAYKTYETTPGQSEIFLLEDTGAGENRILIFGREGNMTWCREVRSLYLDGTFKLAPPLFHQVYVILAERNNHVFPLLYALLPNKRRQTYQLLFQTMARKWPELQPTALSIDYEIAAFQEAQSAFPNAQLFGCLFHLTRNMRKKLAAEQLLARYDSDADFALQARMVVAVAFVPVNSIDAALDALNDVQTGLDPALQSVIDWLEDNYVGRLNRNGRRRNPIFPIQMWNVYDRTVNGQDRTNNHAEAAHRRLQSVLQMDHPSIWRFVDGLRKVQKERDLAFEQMVAGNPPEAKRRKYRQADERILSLVRDFANRPMIEYLRGIAHNFEMSD